MNRQHSWPMYYGASVKLFEYARMMRMAPTEPEQRMWEILNKAPFLLYKFRRQHPISKYIADFYSHPLKLVIEIDGNNHLLEQTKELDRIRDDEMVAQEISVIRLTNEEVLQTPHLAIHKLQQYIGLIPAAKELIVR